MRMMHYIGCTTSLTQPVPPIACRLTFTQYTELLAHLLVHGPFDRNGEIILHPAQSGSGYRPVDTMSIQEALEHTWTYIEQKSAEEERFKLDREIMMTDDDG